MTVLAILGLLGIVAWAAMEVRGFRGTYERMMFEPRPEDRAFARRILGEKFGTAVIDVFVLRVDRDINAIYVIASFSPSSKENPAPDSRTRPDVGPEVVEMSLRDPESGGTYVALLRFNQPGVAFLALAPAGDRRHLEIVESGFAASEKAAFEARSQRPATDSR